MAIQRFKVSLNAARFPLISTKGSRSVFIPGLDSAPRTPRQFVGTEPSTDYNTAQILYIENVMPVAEGLRSVGYQQKIAGTVNNDFDTVFPLRDAEERIALYSPAKGKNYVYDEVAGMWKTSTIESIFGLTLSGSSPKTPATARVTYAYVDGKTFVCYSNLVSTTSVDMSLMVWNPATLELEPAGALIANLPYGVGEIDGIASSNGFLLVWSDLSVAWAAFNGTAFDFTPFANGEFTGAGAQIPEDVQGPVLAIVGVAGGFMMFTSRNCVGASYHAQNTVSPWLFREIAGAGGAAGYEVLTVEGSLPAVYGYTTSGLQRITLNSAEPFQPQVADFITGRQIERYLAATKELLQSSSGQDLAIKVTNIGNRYIAISYGLTEGNYEYVLLWDLALERFGKLKFQHTDCFHYTYIPGDVTLTYDMANSITYDDMDAIAYNDVNQAPTAELSPAQHALGLMTAQGAIYIGEWTDKVRATTDEGVAIIGRIQLSRSRHTQINRIDAEGMEGGSISVVPSYDGRTTSPAIPMVDIVREPGFLSVGELVDAKNFDVLVEGAFDLSALLIEAVPTGQI